MRRSANVSLGLAMAATLAFAASGCAVEPDQEFMDVEADHQQVCVKVQDNGDLIRDDDSKCPDENHSHTSFGPGFWYWYYLGRAYGAPPAVGQTVNRWQGTFTRPSSGTIAKAPSSGGFGTFRSAVGG
jgi:hypothetical protein